MEDALESLGVWRRSRDLAIEIYRNLSSCKDRGFKEQITRAAVSVPSNIAEGFERNSRREFMQFLKIAKGSCAEVRTQICIGREISLLGKPTAERLKRESLELSKMLQGLINRYKPADRP